MHRYCQHVRRHGVLSPGMYLVTSRIYDALRTLFGAPSGSATPTIGNVLARRREDRRVIYNVPATASAHDALKKMVEHGVTCLVVVDTAGEMAGLVTDTDFIQRVALPERSARDTLVHEIATPRDRTAYVYEDNPIDSCMHIMAEVGCHHLPVMSAGGQLLGVVSLQEMIGLTRELREQHRLRRKDPVSILSSALQQAGRKE